jgi:crotonobetainyl-CoA:carnitine CoA-transferase CaiB-like acyl-CoA transferase
VTTVDDDDLGPLRMQNVWFRLDRTPGRIRFAGRRLGQDTDAVLADRLGYSAEEIAALREAGAV